MLRKCIEFLKVDILDKQGLLFLGGRAADPMIPTAGNKCAFSSRPCGRGRVVAHALFPMFATASIMIMATTTHSSSGNLGNVDAEFASLYKEALKPCGKPFCDLFPCYQHHEGKKPQSRQKLKKNHLCRRRRRIFHLFSPSHS